MPTRQIRAADTSTERPSSSLRWHAPRQCVQAELPEKAEKKVVERFSDEYFALLDKREEVGPFLALGKVIFSLDGMIYVVK